MLRRIDGLLATLILVALAIGVVSVQREAERVEGLPRVVDGDSLEIAGRRIRLAGVEAPQLAPACEVAVQGGTAHAGGGGDLGHRRRGVVVEVTQGAVEERFPVSHETRMSHSGARAQLAAAHPRRSSRVSPRGAAETRQP